MNSNEIDMVAFHQGEYSPEEMDAIQQHVAASPDLQAESEAVASFMKTATTALRPVQAPDRIAFGVMQKIRAEASNERQQGAASRRLAHLRTPIVEKNSRRWPSFIMSIALHAAIFMLVAGAAVWFGTQLKPNGIQVDMTMSQRTAAPKILRDLVAGAVDIHDVRPAKAMYLTDDSDGCIWAFPVGLENNPSEEAFLAKVSEKETSRLTRVSTESGSLLIPEKMRKTMLGETSSVLLVSLSDHMEIWSPTRWETYQGRPSLSCVTKTGTEAPILLAMIPLRTY